jgi:hypothetical protein
LVILKTQDQNITAEVAEWRRAAQREVEKLLWVTRFKIAIYKLSITNLADQCLSVQISGISVKPLVVAPLRRVGCGKNSNSWKISFCA